MNTETSTTSQPSPTRSRHRRRRSTLAGLGSIWRAWWVEIIVGLFLSLAIFLLVEQMNIREGLIAWSRQGLANGRALLAALLRGLVLSIRQTTLSDLLAYTLLIVTFGLLTWRTRQRLLTSTRWTSQKCPVCGGGLHRIHRRSLDRVLNLVIPVRRYQCRNHDCLWRGLRVYRGHHR